MAVIAGAASLVPSPAHATAATLAFTATLTVAPAPGPVGPPVNGNWNLSSGVGAGVVASVPGGATFAAVNVAGSLHAGIANVFGAGATCVASGGSDGAGAVNLAPFAVVDVADFGWVQSAAGVILATADTVTSIGARRGGLVAVITPVPVGAACGPATTVVGAAALTF